MLSFPSSVTCSGIAADIVLTRLETRRGRQCTCFCSPSVFSESEMVSSQPGEEILWFKGSVEALALVHGLLLSSVKLARSNCSI